MSANSICTQTQTVIVYSTATPAERRKIGMQIMYKRKGRMICFYDIDNGCVLVGKILWHPKGNVDKVKRINKAIDDYYDSINRN